MRDRLLRLFDPLYVWLTHYLSACGFILYGGGKGDSPPPPDYTPMAQASKEAAEISAQLGREQLAENKRQYDQNTQIAQPVIDAQLKMMEQAKAQGDDYYAYMKDKQRPVEDALQQEGLTGKADSATEKAMQEAADLAVADARVGTTQQQNQLIRQGLRYGWSPAKLAALGSTAAAAGTQATVAAANASRNQVRDKSWAKRLDVAGLYRNLPGASTAAYGAATNAGNSAVGNQNATSQAYMGNMASANGTIMQGQGIRVNGLSSILGSQTSAYNAGAASEGATNGALIGGAVTIGAAMI